MHDTTSSLSASRVHFSAPPPGRGGALARLARGWPVLLVLVMMLVGGMLPESAALAQQYTYLENTPALAQRLTPEVIEAAFPGTHHVTLLTDDGPPAAGAYDAQGTLIGYVFSTLDVVRMPGYSGVPFDIIAGVDLAGRVTGGVMLFHSEPYLDQRRTVLLEQYLPNMSGMTAQAGATDGPMPTFIAGATISARAIRRAVREGAEMVLVARTEQRVVDGPTADTWNFRTKTLEQLLEEGAVRSVRVTNADLERAADRAGLAGKAFERRPDGGPEATYAEFFVGLGSVPTIGRNVAGLATQDRFANTYPAGTSAILLASNGTYDFQGNRYLNRSSGYTLERVKVIQGEQQFTFHRDYYQKGIGGVIGVAAFTGLGVIPSDAGFDPLAPFRVEFLASVKGDDGALIPFTIASVDYQLPSRYVLTLPVPPQPAWVEAWTEARIDIIILGMALVTLTLLLAFQSRLTRSRRLHRWLRLGFLSFTLIWIGWTASAQLSIIHVLNYLQAPFRGLDYTFYLGEPLIVILTVYVALSLILLGRGVFCGWLCPFGALQELLATAARKLKLPVWNPSEALQKRMWWGKYASLAVIVGLTFTLPEAGAVAAEVEPFKTAITSVFTRAWPYMLYAGVLLTIGLFTERAFCRFLCPLGGALALLDRLHLLNLLKRRPECGSPCRLCERACPVRAIEKSGRIEMAECFQCLDCQVEYYDDHRCPPLTKARKKRERAAAKPQTVFTYTPRPAEQS